MRGKKKKYHDFIVFKISDSLLLIRDFNRFPADFILNTLLPSH